jgi:small GTP-binding protein
MDYSRLKCVLVGDYEVGKTSIVNRLINNSFSIYYTSTVGLDFSIKEHQLLNKFYNIHIWDVSAKNKYHSINNFCTDANIVWFCFDMSRPETLKEIENKRKILDPNIYCVLVGCKSDKSVMTAQQIEKFFRNQKFDNYFITSSKYNENILLLLETSLLKSKIDKYFPENFEDHVPLIKKKKKKKCFCFPFLKK